MFIPEKSKQKIFICKSGGWTSIVQAEDCADAASKAVIEALTHFAEKDEPNFVIGSLIMSQEIIEDLESATYFYTPVVLADAGFHDLAKDLQVSNE
jgi:hypothetical protein